MWGLIVPRAGWVAAGGFPTRTNWNKTLPCIPSEEDRRRKIKRKSWFFFVFFGDYSSLLKGNLKENSRFKNHQTTYLFRKWLLNEAVRN